MTKIFSSTYPIHFYECDSYGHLNNAHYVRFAIESIREALIQKIGFDNLDQWYLGEVQIEYKGTTEHADTLSIKTQMSGWRDDGVFFSQEIANGAGDVIAVVYSDWDFITPDTFDAIAVPQDVLNHFFPDGVPAASEFDSFPEEPEAPSGAFNAHRRPRQQNVNPFGLADQGWLINILEELHQDANSYAYIAARFQNNYGLSLARQHNVEWVEPIYEGDELKIVTYISEVDDFSIARWTLISRERDNELVARAQSLWVWVDGDTLEKIEIPAEYFEDVEDQIVS